MIVTSDKLNHKEIVFTKLAGAQRSLIEVLVGKAFKIDTVLEIKDDVEYTKHVSLWSDTVNLLQNLIFKSTSTLPTLDLVSKRQDNQESKNMTQ